MGPSVRHISKEDVTAPVMKGVNDQGRPFILFSIDFEEEGVPKTTSVAFFYKPTAQCLRKDPLFERAGQICFFEGWDNVVTQKDLDALRQIVVTKDHPTLKLAQKYQASAL